MREAEALLSSLEEQRQMAQGIVDAQVLLRKQQLHNSRQASNPLFCLSSLLTPLQPSLLHNLDDLCHASVHVMLLLGSISPDAVICSMLGLCMTYTAWGMVVQLIQ